MKNNSLVYTALSLFVLMMFFSSCKSDSKKNHAQEQTESEQKEMCSGDERVFRSYLYSKLDMKRYFYTNTDFSNSFFHDCLMNKNVQTSRAELALRKSNRYFEFLSFHLILASYREGYADDDNYSHLDNILYKELGIKNDPISKRIAKLYESK